LRHSFASYRYAATQDAPLTAHDLGHSGTQLLYQHYRELVTPEEAERYWKLEPASDTANVVAFSAS
jgi:integrase